MPAARSVLSAPAGIVLYWARWITMGVCMRPDLHGKGSSAHRAHRQAAVRAHIRVHGMWCPGFGIPPHAATQLTADHIHPVSLGGDPRGPYAVLCRSCNSRKGNKMEPDVHVPVVRSRTWL